jgi:hypothetical protein
LRFSLNYPILKLVVILAGSGLQPEPQITVLAQSARLNQL